MDIKRGTFSKILHFAIDEFISSIENSFLPEVINIQKVFHEIVKRRELITQELKNIALSVNNLLHSETEEYDTNNFLEWQNIIKSKVKRLVDDQFSQDLLLMSLNDTEVFHISDDELHDLLYFDAQKDITSFALSPIEVGLQFNFSTPFFTAIPSVQHEMNEIPLVRHSELFNQFKEANMQFDDDLSRMKRILENGFSVSDLNYCNMGIMSNNERYETSSEIGVLQNKKDLKWYEGPQESSSKCFIQNTPDLCTLCFETEDPNERYDDASFHSWEDCLGRGFLREHIYISEAPSEAVHNNISSKDFHTYSCLLNTSDAISENEMIIYILDVLTGIPSDIFFYDSHCRKFRMKSNVHLPNLSVECTARITADFLESGSMYYALQNFSRDFLHAGQGSIFKGMQRGVQKVLRIYKEYIESVKAKSPTMLFLKTDVMKIAELLLHFGIICGINSEQMIIKEIPKGLGLLSYLHDVARSHYRKENGILIAVLFKYAYEPYLRYLNEWMDEGCCNDPYQEFQIIEDVKFLMRRDSSFWKFAYTQNISDPTRAVPPELLDFSLSVLDCGKSVKLLQLLNPDLYHLGFATFKPPPPLSLFFSFPSVIKKVEDCIQYICLKNYADSLPHIQYDGQCDDEFHLEAQKFINKKQMLQLVNRRYNIITAGCSYKSNVINFKKVTSSDTHAAKQNLPVNSTDSQIKCNCFTNVGTVQQDIFRNIGSLFSSTEKHSCINDSQSDNFKSSLDNCKTYFSGKVHHDIGLLFSSCGYMTEDVQPNNMHGDGEWTFLSPNFNKQLCLSSYNCAFATAAGNLHSKSLSSNIEHWNAQALNFKNNSSEDEQFIKEVLMKPLQTLNRGNFNQCAIQNRNPFIDKLATLLVSEYGDSIHEIYSYIKVISLQQLMMHNFKSVINTRIHIVEKMIMNCIVKEYKLDILLVALQNIFFLQDENFSQALCKPLFDKVMKCRTPGEFTKYSDLNALLDNAVSDSDFVSYSSLLSISVKIDSLMHCNTYERIDFLKLFVIECKVHWPLNIIVLDACSHHYSKIFSFLLEIEFLCWLLGKAWRHLIITSKELKVQDEPEYREMMLSRFEMDQFVRVIRNSIHQHLQGPLWEVLQKSLMAERSSIDDLESAHNEYLEKVLARCFLTDGTYRLHDILASMFRQVFRICSAILDCVWEINPENGHYETTYRRMGLSKAFEIFTQQQKLFLEYILKESLTKKCGRSWDKDYQSFLETIVETKSSR